MTTRTYGASRKRATARRLAALDRPELRAPSTPHVFPAGAVSAPIKAEDPATRALIDAALAKRSSAGDAG